MSSSRPATAKESVDFSNFDSTSGSTLECLLFSHRRVVVFLCLMITVLLAWQASHLRLSASFEKTIPTSHPFIANFLKYEPQLFGLGNAVRVAVSNPQGSIYNAEYLATLRELNDEIFLLPGVWRSGMKSIWTPTTRWTAVTEEGLEGGPVIPNGFDGSPSSLQQLSANIARSGEVGQLVSLDAKSSLIFVPLMAKDLDGNSIDYDRFAVSLEELREKYERKGVTIHITGFAKIVGDLIDSIRYVLSFFALTVMITAGAVFWFTRCLRSTLVVVATSLIAVVWQLGLLSLMGFDIDPYSMLVPFLIFAIGMSHGAQKMN